MKAVIFGHIHLIGTSSFRDAPVAGSKLPVVVFIAGYNSYTAQSSALAQDLASNGYVVLSVGTPGDAMAVEFPGGRIKHFRNDEFLRQQTGTISKGQAELATNPPPARVEQMAHELIAALPAGDKALRLEVGDVRALLDRVQRGGLGRLDGHLDAERIAITGMSFGGAVAGQSCFEDGRCKAGVNLDGFQFGDLIGREIGKPFLMIANDDQSGPFFNDMIYRAKVRPKNAPPLINLRVAGSSHVDFTDMTLASPLTKRWFPNRVVGRVDGHRMIALTSDLVTAFLDENLKNAPPSLTKVVKRWPEVSIRRPQLPPGWMP